MAQKVTGYIKLQIEAGKATPAPPVGPALGQKGVNIMAFTKEFNERTKNQMGYVIPVVITVYADRSFSFITKTPPAAVLIKKAAGINTASGKPNKEKVASLTAAQVEEIAKEAGSVRAANIVMLGAAAPFIGIEYDKIEAGIRQIFGRKGEDIVNMNLKALKAGYDLAQSLR